MSTKTHLDVPGPQVPPADHVENTSRSSANDVLAVFELLDVFADTGTTDTSVTLNVHVISQREDDVLDLNGQFSSRREDEGLRLPDRGVDGLKHRDTEGGGFTGTGLSLSDNISSRDDGLDSSLLDGGRLLEV